MSGTLSPVLSGFDSGWDFSAFAHARGLRSGSALADRTSSRRDGAPAGAANVVRMRGQDRAITPQESDIAASSTRHTLSITPDSLPTGVEIAAMPATTAATSSPSARGGALAWLRALLGGSGFSRELFPNWRKKFSPASEPALSTLETPRLTLRATELRGFREFTAPRRMQLGAATPMRARAFGQRTSLRGLSRRSGA